MSNGGKIFFGMFISNFLPCRSATGFLSYWVPLPLPQSQTVCTEKGRPEGTRRCSYPDLVDENRTTGEVLNRLSINGQRVVITKDSDFYHSHLLHGKPWKLVLVRTGNIRTCDLKQLFERHLPAIMTALEGNSLVELDHQAVKVIV